MTLPLQFHGSKRTLVHLVANWPHKSPISNQQANRLYCNCK